MQRLPQVSTSSRGYDPADARGWTNALAGVPLFANLSPRHLKRVAGTGRVTRFHDGTAIVRTGEPGDALYVVLDGEVSVRRPGLSSLPLGIGSFFGELAVLDDGPRTATVIAHGPVVCLTISRSRFLKLMRDESTIAVAVLKEVAARLRAVQATA
jgi:CRP/FNR family cyclic AMP-dependent transcriptional regulator